MTQRTCTTRSFASLGRSSRPSRSRATLLLVLVVCTLVASACSSAQSAEPPQSSTTSSTPPTTSEVEPSRIEVPSEVDENGFDDHTVSSINSVEEFFALARRDEGIEQSVVKFTISNLQGANVDSRNIRWFDSNFFSLHDEYSWFRLLNGHSVPGMNTEPISGESFETIEEIYTWAQARDENDLPLGLRFSRDRLYLNEFYEVGLAETNKTLGLGSLVHYPANELSEVDRWIMELEFSEKTTPVSVEQFFNSLIETLPSEIADGLVWVVRSPHQESTAEEMANADLPFGDAVVRYRDLVPAGQVQVYNPGIAAGRLRLIAPDEFKLTETTDTDILLMENVPDELPAGSALITSAPQTPLAHVNLLARNRGIPNASLSGLMADPAFLRAASIGSHAIVRTTADGELDVTLITRAEFRAWQNSQSPDSISVPEVEGIPVVVDLNELAESLGADGGTIAESAIDEWRPVIGGKAAGFLSLINADGVTTPETPLAITVELYNRHLGLHQDQLDAMLGNQEFQSSSRVRFLLLEGSEDFAEVYTSEDDAEFHDLFVERYAGNDNITAILDADGFMRLLRDTPLDPEDAALLDDALVANFGEYASTQGLRFRSSSSVEDIEGFSGAGLYDSNTGFFDPTVLADEDDHDRTVERAIKKTWASYWGFEAYEERRRENVDHLSGAMAVLVHARFDDELEVNNGVATVTLTNSELGDGDATVRINTQLGDVSVTNPDPDDPQLPEVIEVTLDGADLTTVRVSNSTLSPDDELLDDDEVAELTEQLLAVTELWREQINADLDDAQQVNTVTLDFEFKTMADGWPAIADETEPVPGRLIVKQARSLDPGLRGIPDEALDAPIPRDVLARAAAIDRLDCGDGGTGWSVLTNPLLLPDVGYSAEPFVVEPSGEECEAISLLRSPDQLLIDLLESGTGLELTAAN